nr:uncharacterized protein LOC112748944 [Arachis hypogaea]
MPGPNAQIEDDVLDKDLQPTIKSTQQPEITSEPPNVPTQLPKVTFQEPPRTIQPPNAPTQPNLPTYQSPSIPSQPLEKIPPHPQLSHVPVASEETGHQNSVFAESVTPTLDKGAGMHCHESEELDSIASDDETSQQATFPQGNADAPVREVRKGQPLHS